ncbi:MAG: hypothetical protein ACI9J3_004170 [Parvicellaceae bacterium]|jgi:hypothetical protein
MENFCFYEPSDQPIPIKRFTTLLKKLIIIFGILAVLMVLGYFLLNYLCRISDKCPNCPAYSKSMSESIENDYYLFSYKPLVKGIKLNYHEDSIYFDQAWVESIRIDEDQSCLFEDWQKSEEYRITIEFNSVNKDESRSGFVFMLHAINCPESPGTMTDSKKYIRTYHLPDTLWLNISERNPVDTIGWKKELEGAIIGFIK